jgi:hypothetical protein
LTSSVAFVRLVSLPGEWGAIIDSPRKNRASKTAAVAAKAANSGLAASASTSIEPAPRSQLNGGFPSILVRTREIVVQSLATHAASQVSRPSMAASFFDGIL